MYRTLTEIPGAQRYSASSGRGNSSFFTSRHPRIHADKKKLLQDHYPFMFHDIEWDEIL